MSNSPYIAGFVIVDVSDPSVFQVSNPCKVFFGASIQVAALNNLLIFFVGILLVVRIKRGEERVW